MEDVNMGNELRNLPWPCMCFNFVAAAGRGKCQSHFFAQLRIIPVRQKYVSLLLPTEVLSWMRKTSKEKIKQYHTGFVLQTTKKTSVLLQSTKSVLCNEDCNEDQNLGYTRKTQSTAKRKAQHLQKTKLNYFIYDHINQHKIIVQFLDSSRTQSLMEMVIKKFGSKQWTKKPLTHQLGNPRFTDKPEVLPSTHRCFVAVWQNQ